jgi:MoxR-like ATPase
MQERRVAIGGVEHVLPNPFHVLATQNPLEQEGTYPLPEAQLDRFLMEINVAYPDRDAERKMLVATTGERDATPAQAMSAGDLMTAQALVRVLPIGKSVVEAILTLVRGCRPESAGDDIVKRHVAWGPGPRASQALMLATRARALLDGRLAPSVEDIIALARPILRHRMALNFSARADGVVLTDVIDRLVSKIA